MSLALSPAALNLVEIATREPSAIERLSGRRKAWQALEELARLAEPAAAAHLLPLVLLADLDTAGRAVEAIEAGLAALPPRELPALDESARDHWRSYLYRQTDWLNLAPPLVATLASRFPGRVELLGLLTCHFNGRVRQAALTELRTADPGRALPFLLLRANDWVEPVAALAREVLWEHLRREPCPIEPARLAGCFPLVVRLEERRRRDHSELVGLLAEQLRADEGRALLDQLGSLTLAEARRAFVLLAPAGQPCPPTLRTRIRRHPDPVVRCQVVALFAEANTEESRRELRELVLRDRAVRVRRLALEALADTGSTALAPWLAEVFWDRSASMRGFARFLARQHGIEHDPAPRYRELLEGGGGSVAQREVALSGLGELPENRACPLVARFLNDPSPRVRAAALGALVAMDRREATMHLLEALFDPAARVRSMAHQLVTSQRLALDWRSCQLRAATSESAKLRASVLPLLSRASKWEALELLLANACDPAPVVQTALAIELGRWLYRFNRRQTQPTATELARCRERLAQAASHLPERLARNLGETLRG